jgi:hypothetical protein
MAITGVQSYCFTLAAHRCIGLIGVSSSPGRELVPAGELLLGGPVIASGGMPLRGIPPYGFHGGRAIRRIKAGTPEICENDGICKIAFIHLMPARTPPSLMQMRFPHDFPILIKRH